MRTLICLLMLFSQFSLATVERRDLMRGLSGKITTFSAANGKLYLLQNGVETLEFSPSIAMGYDREFLLPQRDRLNMEIMKIASTCPTNPKFDLSIQRSVAPGWLSTAASIIGGPGTVYFDSIQTIELHPVDCR